MVTSRSSERQPPSLLDGLYQIYQRKIFPIEQGFKFDVFYTSLLSENEIKGKPMVLLLGQYSTGKTTFIQQLLGREYPGARTDRFVAVMNGSQDRVIPGNAAAVRTDKPFTGLSHFGSNFLSKFQVSETLNSLLEDLIIVDTPGVLAGDKQKLGRSYDYPAVIKWFAEHSDLIFLFFDAHKLDVSDELKEVLSVIEAHDDKIRIILNKADQVNRSELMRVYGALMWSLGKVIKTPEVPRVYITSFKAQTIVTEEFQRGLFDEEKSDLLIELRSLPVNSATRKVNDIIRRARLARVHALLIDNLRKKLPSFFGRAAKQQKLLDDLPTEFSSIQQQYSLPVGDFPAIDHFAEILKEIDLSSFPKLTGKQINSLESALRDDLPKLMMSFPNPIASINGTMKRNPFSNSIITKTINESDVWKYESIDQESYRESFISLESNGKVTGQQCRQFFAQSGLGNEVLAALWELADVDRDGQLKEEEFLIMMHLVQLKVSGIEIPSTLPATLLPDYI